MNRHQLASAVATAYVEQEKDGWKKEIVVAYNCKNGTFHCLDYSDFRRDSIHDEDKYPHDIALCFVARDESLSDDGFGADGLFFNVRHYMLGEKNDALWHQMCEDIFDMWPHDIPVEVLIVQKAGIELYALVMGPGGNAVVAVNITGMPMGYSFRLLQRFAKANYMIETDIADMFKDPDSGDFDWPLTFNIIDAEQMMWDVLGDNDGVYKVIANDCLLYNYLMHPISLSSFYPMGNSGDASRWVYNILGGDTGNQIADNKKLISIYKFVSQFMSHGTVPVSTTPETMASIWTVIGRKD